MFTFLICLFIYLFIDRGKGREKERERSINVWLPLMYPSLGTWSTMQACALTGNWTSDILVHSLVLNPLNHTSWVYISYFLCLLQLLNQLDTFLSRCHVLLLHLVSSNVQLLHSLPCMTWFLFKAEISGNRLDSA